MELKSKLAPGPALSLRRGQNTLKQAVLIGDQNLSGAIFNNTHDRRRPLLLNGAVIYKPSFIDFNKLIPIAEPETPTTVLQRRVRLIRHRLCFYRFELEFHVRQRSAKEPVVGQSPKVVSRIGQQTIHIVLSLRVSAIDDEKALELFC